jgi:hypothetical protein
MTQPTRRAFCVTAAATLLHSRAKAQSRAETHPDVAAIDRDRILASAAEALKTPISPITTLPGSRSPGTAHDFYSEPEDFFPDPANPTAPWIQRPGKVNQDAFTAHRDAIYQLGVTVASLAAASAITSDPKYSARAAEHLRAWFITPATVMNPTLQLAQRVPNTPTGRPEGVIDSLPLAEVARSLSFLASSGALTSEELSAIRKWFADYTVWLNDSRTAGLARDRKDHQASSWLFQAAAYADANAIGNTSDDDALNALRHRFKTATLRAQMNGNGIFPREVATPNPFRNALFNLDLLALACELLTTRFDNPWEYELQDGPGLRAAIAYHYPFIKTPSTWPYPADAAHFKELPGRRVSLLLAGRAYTQPSYVDLWRSLSPLAKTAAPELLRTFPVTQPLLWFTRPRTPRI